MQAWKILIVDDEEQWSRIAKEEVGDRTDIIVRHTRSRADTKKLIKHEFFHIALVDLEILAFDDKGNAILRKDGIDVLNDLATVRPSCRRILFTSYYWEERFRYDILGVFKPTNHTADRLIIKDDFVGAIKYLICDCERCWLRAPIRVEGLPQIVEELKCRPGIQWGSDGSEEPADSANVIRIAAYPSEDEIDYLISRVFGQGSEMWQAPEQRSYESDREREMRELYERLSAPTSEDVATVEVMPVGEGLSSSVVMFAVPELKNGKKGVNCIIKVGPIEEIREEYRRFCRFVRFRKSSERRVELLGYEEGDTLGAICLSNAGGADNIKPASLEKLFENRDAVATRCLQVLLNQDKQDWYATSGKPKGLCAHWDDAYPWKKRQEQPLAVRDWLRGDVKAFGTKMERYLLTLEGAKVGIPENVLSHFLFQKNWPTCIIHGDLHGGNIIVGQDARPIFIDYRNVGIGPRCLDFAALESSVRLSFPEDEGPATAKEIVTWAKRERTVLQCVWQKAPVHPRNPLNYWQEISILLGGLAKDNFRPRADHPGIEPVSAEEYCATCILWCLRIFSNRRFSSVQKRRLVIWMSELHHYLERVKKE